ncbi:hypothetical protein RJ55_05786 [Drechmeria coniospora]|nr:hypothetical protein RJ55_05786 [Drechmeria coniospora]
MTNPKPATKRVLNAEPARADRVHSTHVKSEVQFVLPRTQPVRETVRINTNAPPQPFLDPTILEQWRER